MLEVLSFIVVKVTWSFEDRIVSFLHGYKISGGPEILNLQKSGGPEIFSKSPEVRRFLNSHRIIFVFYTQEIVLKNSSTRIIEVLIHAVNIIRMRVVWCFGGSDSPLFRMHAKSPEVRRFRIFKSLEVRWFWVSKPLDLLRFFTPHNYLLWFLVETKVLKKYKIMKC